VAAGVLIAVATEASGLELSGLANLGIGFSGIPLGKLFFIGISYAEVFEVPCPLRGLIPLQPHASC
jgi:hypothetical protein